MSASVPPPLSDRTNLASSGSSGRSSQKLQPFHAPPDASFINTPPPTLRYWSFSTRGPSDFKSAKEDRLIEIDNLGRHVRKHRYDNDLFGDVRVIDHQRVLQNAPSVTGKFGLFGVLDGHSGTFAAEYVKARLPFELVGRGEFGAGDYEAALKASFLSVHEAMLTCSQYKPEVGAFCSGTTVSVVLITAQFTYFAGLGDSPIVAITAKNRTPYMVFDLHDHLNRKECQRIDASNSLLMYYSSREQQFALSWHPAERKELLHLSRPRATLAGVNVFATLGDNIAEPSLFNALLDALIEFKKTGGAGAAVVMPPELQYDTVCNYLKKQTVWASLGRHIDLPAFHSSPVSLRLFFDLVLKLGDPSMLRMVACPLRRVPDVVVEKTSLIHKILMSSDGCIGGRYARGSDEEMYLQSVMNYDELTISVLKNIMRSFPSCNRADDMSSILLHINPERKWGFKQILIVFIFFLFLLFWFFGPMLPSLVTAPAVRISPLVG